jgi:hypothetical protein
MSCMPSHCGAAALWERFISQSRAQIEADDDTDEESTPNATVTAVSHEPECEPAAIAAAEAP